MTPPSSASPDSIEQRRWKLALRIGLGAVALALLVPHFFASPRQWGVGLPRVYSGDEPHYLVLLNSLVQDGDLDVANNYRAVHQGGEEAGRTFAGGSLDHHSAWIANGRYVAWNHVYVMEPDRWEHDAQGHPVPTLLPGTDPSLAATRETSMHWPGLPLLLVPFVWPLGGTTYLEPAALLCVWLAVVLALFSFVSIAAAFGASARTTLLALVLTFLGTPIWNYARALFAEPVALSLLLGAYAILISRHRVLLAGVLCGMVLLLKATYVVMVLPMGLLLLARRQWKDALLFGAPAVVAVGLTMLINHATFGRYLQGPQQWLPGDFLTGAIGLLVSVEHGLLLFAPVCLSAAIGWPRLLREHRADALTALAAVIGMYCLTAPFGLWGGGYCFGPRYLVPAIGFLMLGLLGRLRQAPLRLWHVADLVLLAPLSLWINFRGAVPYWNFFMTHPLLGWLRH